MNTKILTTAKMIMLALEELENGSDKVSTCEIAQTASEYGKHLGVTYNDAYYVLVDRMSFGDIANQIICERSQHAV